MLNLKHIAKVIDNFDAVLRGRKQWTLPDISKLPGVNADEQKREAEFQPPVDPNELISVLSHYNLRGDFSDYHIGCAVTTYEVKVPIGTHLSSITRYRDDLARDLGTPSLRIVKIARDSLTIGFEIENKDRYTVHFKELFEKLPSNLKLPLILGESTYGDAIYYDLADMPHLLVAGQTGSGKSVFLNTLVATLIAKLTPDQVRFLIVDPKQVEFEAYRDIPHFFEEDGDPLQIAYEPDEARYLLDVTVQEMERRFGLLRDAGVKKISDYNKTSEDPLPYIVFIVDEFSDLILMGTRDQKKEVETKIVRLAQKARAVGIHMVLSTQKPLATVMSSLIKGNIPARVSFSVSSGIDSRVILDENGAETLSGQGDMLFRDPAARNEHSRLVRVQAPWISDAEIQYIAQGGTHDHTL